MYAKVGFGLMVLAVVFAIVSFLQENWRTDQTPGALETFVAQWILNRGRPSPSQTRNPLPSTEENLPEGRMHFEKQCAFCHGLDGKGQSQKGIQFYPPVPSLVDPSSELTDGQIHAIVTRGIRYTAMPSFSKVLRPEDIWRIVLWIRHLPQSVPTPQELPPDETERSH